MTATAVALVAASGKDEEPRSAARRQQAETTGPRRSSSTREPTATSTEAPRHEVAIERASGDVYATVLEVRSAPSLSLNQSTYETGSGFESYTDVPAGPEARFVLVKANIRNETSQSMDLTCSYPVENKLIDANGRLFDPIDNLYEYPSNPACNDQLNPGFASEMTYIYLVPSDVAVAGWGFAEVDFADPGGIEPAVFDLIVP